MTSFNLRVISFIPRIAFENTKFGQDLCWAVTSLKLWQPKTENSNKAVKTGNFASLEIRQSRSKLWRPTSEIAVWPLWLSVVVTIIWQHFSSWLGS